MQAVSLFHFTNDLSNLYEMMRHPDDYVLEGDTLHMKFSLLIPFAFFLLLIVVLIVQVLRKEPRVITYKPGLNRKWLLILSAMLPVQFVVLRLGKENLLDVAGVLLTVAQCLLLPRIFITRKARASNGN
jgi:O-antigen ligase